MNFLLIFINIIILIILIMHYLKILNIIQYIKTQKILFNENTYSSVLYCKKIITISCIIYIVLLTLLIILMLIPLKIYCYLYLLFIIFIFFIKLNSYSKYVILNSSIIYLYELKEYQFFDIKDIQIIPLSNKNLRIKFLLPKKNIDIFFKPEDLPQVKIFLETKILHRNLSLNEINLLFPTHKKK